MGIELRGTAASPGIGLGTARTVRMADLDFSTVPFRGETAEQTRLEEAVRLFLLRTEDMAQALGEELGGEAAGILTAQRMMLEDPALRDALRRAIQEGACAEAAVDRACGLFRDRFAGLEDPYLRQRAADIEDLRRRMLALLLGQEETDLTALPPDTVLVLHELTPSMTAGLDRDHIAALVAETGGAAGHAAILARALEVPAVLGIPGALDHIPDGTPLAVDGGSGTVLLDPDGRQQADFQARREHWMADRAGLEAYRREESHTADGRPIAVLANLSRPADAEAAARACAQGAGLFRTEFLFLDRAVPPAEEEQYRAFCQAADQLPGRKLVLRTLDIGGDKSASCLGLEPEADSFLGHRGIRWCLDHPDVFRTQLRAVLRAAAERPGLRLMFPLVDGLEELRAAKDLLAECRTELETEGIPVPRDLPVGIMVETPAAALTADQLAREADFFSIGTNDLIQYTLAVDRGNARVAKLYTPCHPAVLRLLRDILSAGRAAGIPVCLCGEAAADPRLTPLLLAFGLEEFSVSPPSILPLRRRLAVWTMEEARQVAREALERSAAQEIAAYLERVLRA